MSDQPSTPPRLEDLEAALNAVDSRVDLEASPEPARLILEAAWDHAAWLRDPLAVLTSMGAETREVWHPNGWSGDAAVLKPGLPDGEYVVIRKDALEGSE